MAPHVPAPLPNSKAGIMKRVMELQAKLLGPITRMGKKTPLLPQINALHPLFKAYENCVTMKSRLLPGTFFSPLGNSGHASELPAMPQPSPASKGTALIKRRKTETEDDLLDMGDLDGTMIVFNLAFMRSPRSVPDAPLPMLSSVVDTVASSLIVSRWLLLVLRYPARYYYYYYYLFVFRSHR